MNTSRQISVLFICTGNICRSPMAEFIFRHLVNQAGLKEKFVIASAATSSWEIGEPVHPGTQSVLRKNHIPVDFHKRAWQAGPEEYLKFDYVLAMDAYNLRYMPIMEKIQRLTDYAGNHWPKDVPDPYYTGDFDYVYELISEACKGLLDHIRRVEGLQ